MEQEMNKYVLITGNLYGESKVDLTEAFDFEEALVNFYDYYGGTASLLTNLYRKVINGEGSDTAIKLFEKEQRVSVIFFGVVERLPFKNSLDIIKRWKH